MFSTSLLGQTRKPSAFVFYEKPVFLSIDRPGTRRYEISSGTGSEESVDITSNTKKVLISLGLAPYHFWHESVGAMLEIVMANPGTEVLLDVAVSEVKDQPYFPFLLSLMDTHKIKYSEIILDGSTSYLVNNCFIFDIKNPVSNNWSNIVYEFTKQSSIEPYRKVYLSRRGRGYLYNDLKPGLSFNHDIRITDEEQLEEFLLSKGFEIVIAEEIGSYEDQIKFFNETDILCAVTGSAIANSIFMRPSSTVIELATSMIGPFYDDINREMVDGVESLHHETDLVAYEKRHLHIRVPNTTRLSNDIIEYIRRLNV